MLGLIQATSGRDYQYRVKERFSIRGLVVTAVASSPGSQFSIVFFDCDRFDSHAGLNACCSNPSLTPVRRCGIAFVQCLFLPWLCLFFRKDLHHAFRLETPSGEKMVIATDSSYERDQWIAAVDSPAAMRYMYFVACLPFSTRDISDVSCLTLLPTWPP